MTDSSRLAWVRRATGRAWSASAEQVFNKYLPRRDSHPLVYRTSPARTFIGWFPVSWITDNQRSYPVNRTHDSINDNTPEWDARQSGDWGEGQSSVIAYSTSGGFCLWGCIGDIISCGRLFDFGAAYRNRKEKCEVREYAGEHEDQGLRTRSKQMATD